MTKLKTPFQDWQDVVIERVKPKFVRAERNKACPCGSGKKYKKCCRGKRSEIALHHKIKIK